MKNKFAFTIHNVFGHPIMEILYLLGFKDLARKVHDKTLPKKWQEVYEDEWEAGEH
tara:strand:- start:3340 stop:3507 length:168 start_codon:yes stop_codon:yes gene_type:complete